MENTGIAAAGEAGIGGKAGIVGTDVMAERAVEGMVSVVSACGGEEACSVNRRRFPPGSQRSKEPEIRRPGVRRKVQMPFSTDRWFPAPERSGKFPAPGCRGMACHKQEKFCRTKRQTRRAEDRRERAGADAAGGNQSIEISSP